MSDQNQPNQKPDPQQDGDNNNNDPKKNQQSNLVSRGAFGWLIALSVCVMLLLLFTNQSGSAKKVDWQEFLNHAKQGAFEEPVVIEDGRIVGTVGEDFAGRDPNREGAYKVQTGIGPRTKEYRLKQLDQIGQPTVEESGSSIWMQLLITWGPFFVLLILVWYFLFRSLRGAGGGAGMLGQFGRSKHKLVNKEHSTVTLSDVEGIDEAKEDINEIIEFLKSPKKFQRLGGRVPRGVLLIGEPGVGKTLLAKAVAGEAEVPFFSISGSDFVEMFVGVGASRVRDLFKQAKESSPCIIFLDEIDAVGRKRGAGLTSGGHDEREQTLNAILVEMDGFDTSDQVIVMAATNRQDVLDPALTRPGRFDRQVNVPLPDLKGRVKILNVHARKVRLGPDVNLETLARGTPMFSGADLSAIINEAAIAATLSGKDFVEMEDLEEARDKVRFGRAYKSRRIDEDEKKVIAYHESGHAVVMYNDPHSEPLHKVSIIPRGQALGTTFMLPEKDRHIRSRNHLLAQLRVCFGGRIAEEMFLGDVCSGAAQDISQATRIARMMVTQFGMSDRLGFREYTYDDNSGSPWGERSYSDETARVIDEEVKTMIDKAYAETRQMLEEKRQQVEDLAEALLKHETLSRQEVELIMSGKPLNKPSIEDLLKAESNKQSKPAAQPKQKKEDERGDDPAGGAVPSPA